MPLSNIHHSIDPLRLGVENICIIDGDKVELSNLNRQNYTTNDIGKLRTESLKERLLQINQDARIENISAFLNAQNITNHLNRRIDAAINTIDFTSSIPFLFDEIFCNANIPVLHPLNLGWGDAVIVIEQYSKRLIELQADFRGFELCLARHILNELKQMKDAPDYLPGVLKKYAEIKTQGISPPQLAVGSFFVASICTTLLHNLCLKQSLKTFHKVYFEAVT